MASRQLQQRKIVSYKEATPFRMPRPLTRTRDIGDSSGGFVVVLHIVVQSSLRLCDNSQCTVSPSIVI